MRPRPRVRWVVAGLVVAHALVSSTHGVTHAAVPVGLAPWQWGYVLLVATLGPLAALGLVWRGAVGYGSTLLAVSMAGAFGFGTYFHFVSPNPDHVTSVVGPWAAPFEATAVAIAVLELVGAGAGIWLWMKRRR